MDSQSPNNTPTGSPAPPEKVSSEKTMGQKSIGFKVGLMLAAIHLALMIISYALLANSHSSTSALVFIWCFIIDSPFLFLPKGLFQPLGMMGPMIQFGLFGTCLWFLIPWLIDHLIVLSLPRITRGVRWLLVLVLVLLVFFGLAALSPIAIRSSIQQERPAELKKLNTASSTFLSRNDVIDSENQVSGIFRTDCRPGHSEELALSLRGGVIFFDRDFQEKWRLDLGKTFWQIQPVSLGKAGGCGFLVYDLNQSASLLDSQGKLIWTYDRSKQPSGRLDGVCPGDMDGDGVPEFAVYYSYREGIRLLNVNGTERWKHPVYSLGHIEFSDIDGNAGDELLYTNSNNAGGETHLTALDSHGNAVLETKFKTESYEFAVVRWPTGEGKSRILLTEDNRIRLVTLKGDAERTLDAPGCRTYGTVTAATVKFRNNEPEYLAVVKHLHPDIQVLYVYNGSGALVYQYNDVALIHMEYGMTTIPSGETGAEDLLLIRWKDNNERAVTKYSAKR
jgi:hypothetical protein